MASLLRLGMTAAVIGALVASVNVFAQAADPVPAPHPAGPYARIAVLRPLGGRTVDFESGYIRHLDWHRRAGDAWRWFGWTITFGDRQRWFVYATFGHSAASLDNSVAPADDERDNILNVVPHAEFAGNALVEYLPGLSRSQSATGVPTAAARLEMTSVEIAAGAGATFEAALAADAPSVSGETLWYRMVAGGTAPRYMRLRPRATFVDTAVAAALPDGAARLASRVTLEILTLRPTMSLRLP